ncbi:MAG: glycosyltransferase [Bacillota bacterium]
MDPGDYPSSWVFTPRNGIIVKSPQSAHGHVFQWQTATHGTRGKGGDATRHAQQDADILMIIPSWGKRCGVAEYTRALADELRKQGLPVEVTTGRAGEILSLACRGRYRVAHFQFEYRLFDVASLRYLASQLKAYGVRVMATVHDFYPGNTAGNNLIRDAFSDIIVHSERLGEELCRLGIDRGRIHVIPMGCPKVDLIEEGRTRAALGVGPGPGLGFFGFALPQKGLVELAVAAKALRENVFPHLKVFAFAAPPFFGDEYVHELAGLLHSSGLAQGFMLRTDYLPVRDVVNYLHAMDINILPYKEASYIGTSSAVRVLMAAEKPIITTDIPYFDDLDGEVFKIPSADPDRIAEAVLCLMANPARREEMVCRIRRYVEDNDWSQVSERHAALYRVQGRPDQAGAWTTRGTMYHALHGPSIPSVPPEVWERLVKRFGKKG